MNSRPKKKAQLRARKETSALEQKIATASQRASVTRQAAGTAKEKLKESRKAFKLAKKAAKEARKKFKALKMRLWAEASVLTKAKKTKAETVRRPPLKRPRPAAKQQRERKAPTALTKLPSAKLKPAALKVKKLTSPEPDLTPITLDLKSNDGVQNRESSAPSAPSASSGANVLPAGFGTEPTTPPWGR